LAEKRKKRTDDVGDYARIALECFFRAEKRFSRKLSVNQTFPNYVKAQNMKSLRTQEEIIASWQTDLVHPLVSICCISYNHELYIEDALRGFLIQKTDFAFEILIHDDSSSDRTKDIIRKYQQLYPKLIKPIFQVENQYSKGKIRPNPIFNFPRAKGDYLALCEGDDYWLSDNKLQKQIDFIRENPECSMIFHRAEMEMHGGFTSFEKQSKSFGKTKVFDKSFLFYEGGSSAPTASLLFRKKSVEVIPDFYEISPVGDMPLKLKCSFDGQVGYIDEVMCVRRIGTPGSWNVRTRLDKKNESNYLMGMLTMLEAFDEFSDRRWTSKIDRIKVGYSIRLNELGVQCWTDVNAHFSGYVESLNFFDRLKIKIRIIRSRARRFSALMNKL